MSGTGSSKHQLGGVGRADPGEIVRHFRRAKNLTLAQLAGRCGYSVSTLSRMERGKQPLRDVGVLRALAGALEIDPKVLGITATSANPPPPGGLGVMVDVDSDQAEEIDPMRRRTLLTGLTGVAGAAVLGARAAAATDQQIFALLTALHTQDPTARPIGMEQLRRAVATCRALLEQGRYGELATRAPRVLSAALATATEAAGPDTAVAWTHVAAVYVVTSELMVKLGHDHLASTTADRAVQAATASGEPLTRAAARRAWAIALRKAGHADIARTVLLDAADELRRDAGGRAHLHVYGALLTTAAYTAAVDGDRDGAGTLVTEAAAAADRLGAGSDHHAFFGPAVVGLYRIGMARVLGDCGTAIAVARRVDPARLPTPERRARYWTDVARAFHQWGKPEPCFRALLAAERAAPDEVRHRKPVQRLAADLVRHPGAPSLPGLRAFAARVGNPV